VIGLDLSLKMIRFAGERNSCPDVTFVHGDATDLSIYPDHSFDFAVMLVFIHELDAGQQKQALSEALRVANPNTQVGSGTLLIGVGTSVALAENN